MARKQPPSPVPAILSVEQITKAIPALERRIADLKTLEFDELTEENGDNTLNSLTQKINATLREIFGPDSIEYKECEIGSLNGYGIRRMNPYSKPVDSSRPLLLQEWFRLCSLISVLCTPTSLAV
jgi:hypothetical protein